MKYGPLVYRNPAGIYEEDPATVAVQNKMERALSSQAARQVRKLIATRSWVIHKHGANPHTMSLPVSFHVLDDGEIQVIKDQAAKEERARILRDIQGMLG